MINPDNFYSDVGQAWSTAVYIKRGKLRNCISLKAAGDRFLVIVAGEPTGDNLLECFQAAMGLNVLHPDMRALVDLTRFIGAVDWAAVFSLRKMMPWGESGNNRSRVAYLIRDNYSAPLIKIASVMFTHTRHRAFTDRETAIAWLEDPMRE